MEYVQMTLTDWMEIKHKLKMELQGVKQSFVRIGYLLRKIDDQKAYESDGYKSIAEFAKAEYGLEASTVSRFMSINREYSIEGYSEHLREEYLEMGRSQLEEMLKLPEQDRTMIQPEASREDIRELKRFNKTEPEQGTADDLQNLVKQFFAANTELLKELSASDAYVTGEIEKMVEIVNPSGNKAFRKGLYFMMMYEENIKIKKYGQNPETMSWADFFSIAREIIDTDVMDEEPEEVEVFEEEKTLIESKTEENDSMGVERTLKPTDTISDDYKTKEKSKEKEVKKEQDLPIAPAQKSAKTLSETAFSEEVKEVKSEVENEAKPEKIQLMSRKEYMDGLTAYGAADYIGKLIRSQGPDVSQLIKNSFWQQWFQTEVDECGQEIIDEDRENEYGQISINDMPGIIPEQSE